MATSKASFSDFKALTLDCYGTIIDWETGILEALEPLLSRLPSGHRYHKDANALLAHFNTFQHPFEVINPTMSYPDVLAYACRKVAEDEGVEITEEELINFGDSAGSWPAFPDSVAGLLRLQKYYKLVIISNVDRANINRTLAGPLAGVKFDAVYTAEEIGSYKPDHRNFAYLFQHVDEAFNIKKAVILHTAKSLPIDHVPAKELGLTSAWIARGQDGLSGMGGDLALFKDKVAFSWRFPSIGAMAEEVDKTLSNA